METAEAKQFLESLLGKTLHVTVPDGETPRPRTSIGDQIAGLMINQTGRLFTGTFRCTDNESNIILANAFEYRHPSPAATKAALARAESTGQASRANMTSRFVGLVVIPGGQIAKMEVEERRDDAGGQSLAIRAKP